MTTALWLPYLIAFTLNWAFAGVEVPDGKGGSAMYDYAQSKDECVQGPALRTPDGKGGTVYFCQVK